MTEIEAKKFGRDSALEAIDQVDAFEDMDLALINYMENIGDTVTDPAMWQVACDAFCAVMKEKNLTCRYL